MPETIGQQLQNARETRGFTLEETSRATCIRARYLQGLETDNRSAFPSPVQGKGFLRNYAAFLGLPVQPLLDQWDGKAPQVVQTPPPAPAPVAPASVAEPMPGKNEALESFEENEPETAAESIPQSIPQSVPQPAIRAAIPNRPTPGSQRIFDEIGQTLREQREALSLSLTEIEKYTHVRMHYLKALEAGKMDELPSMVQGRGMLNNYARFLNLDANQVMNRFADALQLRREEMNVVVPTHHTPVKVAKHPMLRRFLSMDLIVGGGLVLVLVTFVIWGAAQVMDAVSQDNGVEQTAPPVSEILINSTADPVGTETLAALGTDALSEATAPAATDEVPAEEGTPGAEQTTTGEAGGPPAVVSGKVQVYVVALQRVWMKVTVDGKVEFTGRATAGNAYTYEGDETIELVTGNAAALQIYYNGENLGTLGNVDQVVDLIYTVDQGVLGPTPTITATPTKTPRVTVTPTPGTTTSPNNAATTTAP